MFSRQLYNHYIANYIVDVSNNVIFSQHVPPSVIQGYETQWAYCTHFIKV